MSKVFSIIGLETNTGIRDIGFMSGIPEMDDIQSSALYRELVEDCGSSDYIVITVKSYRWGEGDPQPATAEDLEVLRTQPKIISGNEITCIGTSRFAILYPDQGMKLNM